MFIPKKLRTLVLFVGLILLVFISFCLLTPTKSPANPPEDKLTYHSKTGDVLVYESVRENTRTMERSGESSEFTTTRTYNFQLKTETAMDSLSFELTVNKLETAGEGGRGFRGPNLDPEKIIGKRARITIKTNGEVKGITAIDSIAFEEQPGREERGGRPPGSRMNPVNLLRVAFFMLPDRPIKIGDSWTEDYQEPAGSDLSFGRFSQERKVTGKSKFSVVGKEKKLGLDCYHIRVESQYESEAHGSMRGSDYNSEGEGEVKADAWFAHKEGVLVEYQTNEFYEGTTAISGETNRTMANSNETKSTLKLVKYSPK